MTKLSLCPESTASPAHSTRSCFLVLCWMLIGVLSFAQMETATVSGTVMDHSGAVVAGAQVQVINSDTNVTATTSTNGSGTYVVPSLKPGRYRIAVTKAGFKQVVVTDVILNVQDVVSRNFNLEIGAVSESITVTADQENVNTKDASVSTVVDQKFAEELPLNGRSFQTLFQLTPGVVTATTSFYDQGQFNINGQRGDANYFMVDGVSANIGISPAPLGQSAGGALPALTASGGMNNLVSVDALQEFRIQTSTYAPEFGRTPGGQIEIVTRSGTNQFHGNLFDYFRNDVLDANDWFADQQGLRKPPLRQNDFGGVLGGPIIKDRTFFFFSYEGLRLRQPKVGITEVPSATARQNAPATTQPLLNAFPVPNGPDLGNDLSQFSGSYSDPSTLNATSIRIDHTVNGKMNLFGRYNYSPSSSVQRNGGLGTLSALFPVNFQTQTFTLGTTLLISQKMTNDLRFNYSRVSAGSHFVLDNFGGAVPPSNSILFPSFASPTDTAFFFDCCNYTVGFAVGDNSQNRQQQFNVVDGVSLVKGSHHLKFGVDYRRLSPFNGRRKYDSQFVFNDVAQVLTGVAANAYVTGAYNSGLTLAFNNFSAYAQDTWNVTRRLSATYGIRWDVNPPPHVTSGPAPWAVTQINDLSQLAIAPQGTPLWHTRYANFAPRIGLAYQLSQSPRWGNVLRGGFGIFYDLGYGQIGDPLAVNDQYYGFTVLSNVAFPLDPSLAPPPPAPTSPPYSQIAAFDPHLKSPYTYEWNLSFEQSMGANQTFTVSDVGARGRRMLREDLLSGASPDFGEIYFIHNADTSDYDALQLQYKRRLSTGLQGLASYTWSHSIDTSSFDAYQLDPGRGPSNFDIRNSFAGAVSYLIPIPSQRTLAKSVLGGWSLDAKAIARSATPVNIIAESFAINGSTFVNVRPDVVPGIPLYLYGSQYPGGKAFNNTPGAVVGGCPDGSQSVGPFCTPPAGQLGNMGRNALRGFGATQLDFTLRREFPFTERWKLQFSADFFNIFNHPNFADPDNTLTDPFFGRSLSMLGQSLGSGGVSGGFSPLYQIGGPRSIQLVLKLVF